MYDFLIEQAFNKPQLVLPERLDAIGAFLLARQGYDIEVPKQPEPQAFVAPDTAVYQQDGGYYLDSGVAIINMIGTMVHRSGGMQALSGLTSYNTISRRFRRAMSDPNTKATYLISDTPGGSVNGAFDLADEILQARGSKPVYVIAADTMASAGYLIGSGADKVFVTQTGRVGSIGVVMKHIDFSVYNEKRGINPTYIYAGSAKIEGNPDQPLSEGVMAKFQSEIDKLYNMFVTSVSLRRGLNRESIINTQARMFMGEDAVNTGLADGVTTGDELLETMKLKYGVSSHSRVFATTTTIGTKTMNENDKPLIDAEKTGASTASADENTTAVDVDAIETHATTKAIKLERERFASVMNSEHAKGRISAAVSLCTESDMSAEAAIAMLQKLPAEKAHVSKLDQVMASIAQPGIGSEGQEQTELTDAQMIVRDYRQATGKPTTK